MEGGCSPQKFDEELLSTGSSISEDLESIYMVCNLAISEESLTMIKQATELDNDLEKLKTVIRQGWPETKDQIAPSLAEYLNFYDELSIQNGLIFKGERLVIPYGVRLHMKARIQSYWRSGVSKTCKRQCVLAWNDETTDRVYFETSNVQQRLSTRSPERTTDQSPDSRTTMGKCWQ